MGEKIKGIVKKVSITSAVLIVAVIRDSYDNKQ